MKKILFVCHGNICRSPMAEFVLRELVRARGVAHLYQIESAATSAEEIGNPVHPGTRKILARLGISAKDKRARRIVPADYADFDILIGMDSRNLQNMRRAFGGDPAGKIRPMLAERDVADPWYTGDFEQTYRDVLRGCEALLDAQIPR